MKNNIKIEQNLRYSIIIPAYNVEKYIISCIQSIEEQQDDVSFEVIIIDDGSTDQTFELCCRMQSKYDNIRIIQQSNKGQSSARNRGMKAALGEYIIFVDSDDLMYSGALRSISKIIDRTNGDAEMVISRWVEFSDNLSTVKESQMYYINLAQWGDTDNVSTFYYLLSINAVGVVWIYAAKRSYLYEKELYFYEGILHEDEEWVCRFILNANKISFNNSIVYCYRTGRKGSTITTNNIKKEFDKLKIIKLLDEEQQKNVYSDRAKTAISLRIQTLVFGMATSVSYYQTDERYLELKNEIKRNLWRLKGSSRILYRFCYGIVSMGVPLEILAKIAGRMKGRNLFKRHFYMKKITKRTKMSVAEKGYNDSNCTKQ